MRHLTLLRTNQPRRVVLLPGFGVCYYSIYSDYPHRNQRDGTCTPTFVALWYDHIREEKRLVRLRP